MARPILTPILIGLLTTALFHLVVWQVRPAYWTTGAVWDEAYNVSIARVGYGLSDGDFHQPNRLPFSPGYPLLLRGLWNLTGVFPTYWRSPVGVVLFLASCLLLPWVLRAFSSDHARNNRTLALFSLWPGSIYFRSGYSEALYLPLLLGAIGFMLRGRWLPAALLTGAAWFTRTPAVVLVGTLAAAIVLEAARRPTLRIALRHAWLRLSWAMPIAALGMLGYIAMVNSATGDPWAWRKAYVGWGSIEVVSSRGLELRTAVDAFWFLTDRPTVKLAIPAFLLTPLLVWIQRARMPATLVAFAAGAWGFFLSQDWALAPYWDMTRWMSVVFPFHLALVLTFDSLRVLPRRIAYIVWLGASTAGFVWFTTLYVNNLWAS